MLLLRLDSIKEVSLALYQNNEVDALLARIERIYQEVDEETQDYLMRLHSEFTKDMETLINNIQKRKRLINQVSQILNQIEESQNVDSLDIFSQEEDRRRIFSMNAWEILGIEPTKDKKEIKKAYARLLKQYHPEENPEEFKQIQAAYQQCLHPDQEIESVSFEQNKQDIQTQSILTKEDTIIPPPIPKVETLFVKNEKDIVVYQDILNSIEKSLPKKIGSKEIVQVFTEPKIMPYLEDELFCRRLEDIFLSRKLKYIKNFRDPIYMYLGKYGMSKLSNAMDYSNVPLYKRPAFTAFIVISVILLEVILGIL